MMYERKEYEIITGAEDIRGNCLSFVVADVDSVHAVYERDRICS